MVYALETMKPPTKDGPDGAGGAGVPLEAGVLADNAFTRSSRGAVVGKEFTVQWIPYAAFAEGNFIRGDLQVTSDGKDTVVPVFMYPRTITAFATTRGIEESDVASQLQLGSRVLAQWGKRQVEAALNADAPLPSSLTLNATVVDASVILRELGSSLEHAP